MVTDTKVVHIDAVDLTDKDVVYIGRPSLFGNPFTIGPHGTRQEVIEKYRKWVNSQDEQAVRIRKRLHNLIGKRLACYCAPNPCHGDVLKEMVDVL